MFKIMLSKTLEEAIKRSSSEFKNQVDPRLPYQSAEQILRLEELILNFHVQKDDGWYSYSAMNCIGKISKTRANALYSFIGNLIVKGILSCEQVKEVLIGKDI